MKKIIFKNGWWLIGAAWVYTLTFVFNNYWSRFSSLPSIAKSFEKKVQAQIKKFDEFSADTLLLKKLSSTTKSEPLHDEDAYYYLFEDRPDGLQLEYWSNAVVIPPANEVPYNDTVKLVTYPNGTFLLSARNIRSHNLIAVQLVPIKWQYFIENEYLAPRYPGFDGLEKYISITDTATLDPVRLSDDKIAFYLQKIAAKPLQVFNWPSFFIEMIATLFLIVFFQRCATGLASADRFKAAMLFIVIGSVGTRLAIRHLNFPVNFSELTFFTGGNGSLFFRSLGDLLLNLLSTLWIFYFLRAQESRWMPGLTRLPSVVKALVALGAIVCLVVFTFVVAEITGQLILHPAVSFDVSNFFSLGWDTLLAIICMYIMAVIHYIFLHKANQVFVLLWPFRKFDKYFLVAITGLIILSFSIQWHNTTLLLLVLAWILVSFLLEDNIPQRLVAKITPSASFLFWMIWYALSGMLLVLGQNNAKEGEQRIRVAQKLGIQSDATAEQLLNLALISPEIRNMGNSFNLFYDSTYHNIFFSGLRARYFSGLLASFETSFYLFDPKGKPIFNKDSVSFETLNTISEEEATKTKFTGINYYERTFEKFSYVIKQPLLLPADSSQAFLFITSTPTRFKKDAMVPELLKRLQENNKDYTDNYSYAVYDKGKLVSSNKDYPFVTQLEKTDLPRSEREIRTLSGTDQLWYNAGNGRTIIVVRQSSQLSDGITLFAYLFGTFILLTFFERFLTSLFNRKRRSEPFSFNISRLTINQKIHGTIYLICFISFVVIGFVTIKFFIYRFHQNNTNRLTKAITLVNNDLQKTSSLHYYLTMGGIANTEAIKVAIQPSIKRVAELQNVDINLYSKFGDLVATSQPIVFERGIISQKMNEQAFYNLAIKKKVQFLQNESIGTLEYSSIYLPVRTSNGETIGFLNIPYFSSQNDLNQEISNFLVALINFNAFIFLLAGIIAFFIANNITSSFALIGEKMKAIGFGKSNESIIWDRNDEIGALVLEYNKMIAALDESAKKLARSERESAWREMAKQVAHEIKNPLTPMKLSLQYLQRAIDNNTPNVKELAGQVATNLVEQIDHLSRIASDFSQFAQIDLAKKEIFDLHETIQQVVLLYEKNRHAHIQWKLIGKPLFIEADKTQINRLFTNLLQNACEASDGGEGIDITIAEQANDYHITISITDKGSGIPTELHDHIFTPNFTTKTSGTGLGLAICRDIVEKSHGTIWFETELGRGTTFFIKLPLKQRAN
ncbi:MAG: HAMP domain-containing sensor histidine kinase [Bacteroidota bacterium]